MALVIEDGTGLADAVSYASVADLKAFAALRGETLQDDDQKLEALLAKAMERLAGLDYRGERATRDQALDWPRVGVLIEGFVYPSTLIPNYLKQAQMAFALAARTMDLLPTTPANTAGPVISRTVGPITTTYANVGATRRTPGVPAAEQPLAKVLRHVGLSVVRA